VGLYIDQTKLEAFVAPHVVKQVLDDDDNGAPDASAVARCISDGEAILNGKLRGVYILPLIAPIDTLVETISLMLASGFLAQRHAEYVRYDGGKRLEEGLKLADQLREGDMQIDHPLVGTSGTGDGDTTTGGAPDALSYTPRGFNAILGEGD